MGIFDRLRKKGTVQIPESAPETDTSSEKKEDASVEAKAPIVRPASGVVAGRRARLANWIKRPQVSEKAAYLAERGVYVFHVPVQAEKRVIKQAVEAWYDVKVVRVHTIRQQGKPVNRRPHPGARAAWKKALVTLAPGQKIEIYKGV